jgi:hypothetical protein
MSVCGCVCVRAVRGSAVETKSIAKLETTCLPLTLVHNGVDLMGHAREHIEREVLVGMLLQSADVVDPPFACVHGCDQSEERRIQ